MDAGNMQNDNWAIEQFNNKIKEELAQVRDEEDVLSYLRRFRGNFMSGLEVLPYTSREPERDKMIIDVDEQWNLIIECLKAYMEGKHSAALRTMKNILKKESQIPRRVIQIKNNLDFSQKKILNLPWYRMRICESNSRLTYKDMFHVPFEKRTLVKSCRYSVLG